MPVTRIYVTWAASNRGTCKGCGSPFAKGDSKVRAPSWTWLSHLLQSSKPSTILFIKLLMLFHMLCTRPRGLGNRILPAIQPIAPSLVELLTYFTFSFFFLVTGTLLTNILCFILLSIISRLRFAGRPSSTLAPMTISTMCGAACTIWRRTRSSRISITNYQRMSWSSWTLVSLYVILCVWRVHKCVIMQFCVLSDNVYPSRNVKRDAKVGMRRYPRVVYLILRINLSNLSPLPFSSFFLPPLSLSFST